MITLTIRSRSGVTVKELVLCRTDEEPVPCPEVIDELDKLQFDLRELPVAETLELLAGDTLLAAEPDQAWQEGGTYAARWVERKYLMMYTGTCTLTVRGASTGTVYFVTELTVRPEKLTVPEMEAMLSDLQRLEAGLIYDVYSKTEVAANGRANVANIVPEVFLQDAKSALGELQEALSEIRRRPHHGNRMVWERRNYRPGQVLQAQEISAICAAPDALARTAAGDPDAIHAAGRHLSIAYVPSSNVVPDLNVYEHRAIRGFLDWLRRALKELAGIARQEHDERLAARGQYHWWEEEDQPRLKSLREREELCINLLHKCASLVRDNPPLASASTTSPPLRMTAAFARRPAYRRALAAMALWEGQLGTEVRLTGPGQRFRIQDLSKLYEYWGVLAVVDCVRRRFRLLGTADQTFVDTQRFVVRLRKGAHATFRTGDGRYIKLRYEPDYPTQAAGGKFFGTKSGGALCPDIAMEVYDRREDTVPQQIIVLDCKYRWVGRDPLDSVPFAELAKYPRGLIEFSTKRKLIRHLWMIYPITAQRYSNEQSVPIGALHPFPADFLTGDPDQGSESDGAVPVSPGQDQLALRLTLNRIFDMEGLTLFPEG